MYQPQPSPVMSQPITQPHPSPIQSQQVANVAPPTNAMIPPITNPIPPPVAIVAPIANTALPPNMAPPASIVPPTPTIPVVPPSTPASAPTAPTVHFANVATSVSSLPTGQQSTRASTSHNTFVSTASSQTVQQQSTVNPPPTNPPVSSMSTPAPSTYGNASPGGNDPNDNPDDSSSSDDNSSNSSESDGYRYDSQGRRKKRKKKSRSTAKIVFELNKNASYSDFKPLEFHPDLDRRQASFLYFTRKLRQLCRSAPELCQVFEYPNELMAPKTKRADAALYDFLLSKVSNKTATMLETYMIEHKKRDGITAFKFLQMLSAPQDADSQHIALTKYRSLALNDREFLQSFHSRFNIALTNLLLLVLLSIRAKSSINT
jgi:hypothetical protein